MKVTEKLVTKDHSKLVSAILADQVNRHQQLLLTWECPDVETAGMVERFIKPVLHVGSGTHFCG